MSCNHIQRLISERLDRPLQPAEAEQVRAHMAGCRECAGYSRTLQAGLAGLNTLPAVPASQRVRENVLAYVDAARYGAARPRNAGEWFSYGAKIAGAMAAFVIVALVVASLFNGSATNNRPGQTSAGAGNPTSTPVETVAEAESTLTSGSLLTPMPEVSPPVTLPACQPGQVELSAEASIVSGYWDGPDFVNITITALKSTGGIVCQFSEQLNVAVVGADGQPVDVIGNFGRWEFDTPVPGEQASVSFAWTNWCGDTDGVSVSANTDTGDLDVDVSVTLDGLITPSCSNPDASSTLGVLVPQDPSDSLPPCDLGENATFNHYWEKRDGTVRLWVGGTSMQACSPAEDVTITLVDTSRPPLEIVGNAASTREVRGIGAVYYAGFEWSNWCGNAESLQLDIARPGMGEGGDIPFVPECENPDEPSRLEVITVDMLRQSGANTTVGSPPSSDLQSR